MNDRMKLVHQHTVDLTSHHLIISPHATLSLPDESPCTENVVFLDFRFFWENTLNLAGTSIREIQVFHSLAWHFMSVWQHTHKVPMPKALATHTRYVFVFVYVCVCVCECCRSEI